MVGEQNDRKELQLSNYFTPAPWNEEKQEEDEIRGQSLHKKRPHDRGWKDRVTLPQAPPSSSPLPRAMPQQPQNYSPYSMPQPQMQQQQQPSMTPQMQASQTHPQQHYGYTQHVPPEHQQYQYPQGEIPQPRKSPQSQVFQPNLGNHMMQKKPQRQTPTTYPKDRDMTSPPSTNLDPKRHYDQVVQFNAGRPSQQQLNPPPHDNFAMKGNIPFLSQMAAAQMRSPVGIFPMNGRNIPFPHQMNHPNLLLQHPVYGTNFHQNQMQIYPNSSSLLSSPIMNQGQGMPIIPPQMMQPDMMNPQMPYLNPQTGMPFLQNMNLQNLPQQLHPSQVLHSQVGLPQSFAMQGLQSANVPAMGNLIRMNNKMYPSEHLVPSEYRPGVSQQYPVKQSLVEERPEPSPRGDQSPILPNPPKKQEQQVETPRHGMSRKRNLSPTHSADYDKKYKYDKQNWQQNAQQNFRKKKEWYDNQWQESWTEEETKKRKRQWYEEDKNNDWEKKSEVESFEKWRETEREKEHKEKIKTEEVEYKRNEEVSYWSQSHEMWMKVTIICAYCPTTELKNETDERHYIIDVQGQRRLAPASKLQKANAAKERHVYSAPPNNKKFVHAKRKHIVGGQKAEKDGSAAKSYDKTDCPVKQQVMNFGLKAYHVDGYRIHSSTVTNTLYSRESILFKVKYEEGTSTVLRNPEMHFCRRPRDFIKYHANFLVKYAAEFHPKNLTSKIFSSRPLFRKENFLQKSLAFYLESASFLVQSVKKSDFSVLEIGCGPRAAWLLEISKLLGGARFPDRRFVGIDAVRETAREAQEYCTMAVSYTDTPSTCVTILHDAVDQFQEKDKFDLIVCDWVASLAACDGCLQAFMRSKELLKDDHEFGVCPRLIQASFRPVTSAPKNVNEIRMPRSHCYFALDGVAKETLVGDEELKLPPVDLETGSFVDLTQRTTLQLGPFKEIVSICGFIISFDCFVSTLDSPSISSSSSGSAAFVGFPANSQLPKSGQLPLSSLDLALGEVVSLEILIYPSTNGIEDHEEVEQSEVLVLPVLEDKPKHAFTVEIYVPQRKIHAAWNLATGRCHELSSDVEKSPLTAKNVTFTDLALDPELRERFGL